MFASTQTSNAPIGKNSYRGLFIAQDCEALGKIAFRGIEIGHKFCGMLSDDVELTNTSCIGLVCDIFFLYNIVIDMKTARTLIEQNQTGWIKHFKELLTKKRHRRSSKLLCQQDENEIITEIKRVETAEEAQLLLLCDSRAGISRVIEDIKNNWSEHASEIFKILLKFGYIVFEKLKKNELKTWGDLYFLIILFLWSFIRPIIGRWMQERKFSTKLDDYLDENLERLVFTIIANFIQTYYDKPFIEGNWEFLIDLILKFIDSCKT